jgi:hypothetical protein
VRPRTPLLFALVALLGAATAVPALATASEVKLEVNENCVEPDWPCWATPGSSQPASKVTIASSDSVTFADSKTAANIAWTGTAPMCESEVPVAPASPKTGWEGKCTFEKAGTYHFESSTLFDDGVDNYTKYEVVVGGTPTTPPAAEPAVSTLAASALEETEAVLNGKVDPEGGAEAECFFEWGAGSGGSYEHTTKVVSLPPDGAEHQVSATVTGLTPGSEYHFRLVAKNKLGSVQGNGLTFMAASTPPAKDPTTEPPAKESSPAPTSTGGNSTATTSSSPSSGPPKTEPAAGPLFGSVKLASPPHGGVVHGSLIVSSVGSEGQLQIELLTKGATAVGKLVRSSLHAGKLTFALPLSAKGKAALRRHRRLTLTVKITLTPQHGAAVTVTRGIVVRA